MKAYGNHWLILLVLVMGLTTCQTEKPSVSAKNQVLQRIQTFERFVADTLKPAVQAGQTATLQTHFRRARILYKSFEWAAEYYTPTITRFVNGAPVPEVEIDENRVRDPEGLQVIEGLLFPAYQPENQKELTRQVALLAAQAIRYRDYFQAIEFTDAQVFDALKLEIFRVVTLGITGFDTPLSGTAMLEAAASLSALQQSPYLSESDDSFRQLLSNAIQYLRQHSDFESFDRSEFILRYGNPLSQAWISLQQKQNIPYPTDDRLLRADARTLFEPNAFHPDAYAGNPTRRSTPEKIALGKRLFEEVRLSGNGQRSCASCHIPSLAYTDGLPQNQAFDGHTKLKRNTPTLLNAGLQPALFADLRTPTLENQARTVVMSTDEMHGSLQAATALIRNDSAYQQLFRRAYPKVTDPGDTEVFNALAAFIRSLTSLNSRFDQHMRGQPNRMNAQEIRGFNLFMGKAKCGTCHFMPLFNGTVPPGFTKMESEVIGVPQTKAGRNIDPDVGRFRMSAVAPFLHSFKTTTVRNTARTAPYMHNGVYQTLDEVIDFYAKGGGVGLGLSVPNQTLPFEKLSLTPADTQALLAFLKCLDEE